MEYEDCKKCKGSGYVYKHGDYWECTVCGGQGTVKKTKMKKSSVKETMTELGVIEAAGLVVEALS
jgi:DnaJ-class molecular chaperone